MVELSRALIRRGRSEGGFTLTELSVGFTVSLIVAVAVMTFILISTRQWQGQEERVTSIDEARNTIQLMIGELRDANNVRWVDQRTVDASVRTAAGSYEQVRYQCTGTPPSGSCTRTVSGSGVSKPLVDRVQNVNNFSVTSASDVPGVPTLGGTLRILLQLDLDKAENPIVLSSAVKPRNCAPAGAGVVNRPC